MLKIKTTIIGENEIYSEVARQRNEGIGAMDRFLYGEANRVENKAVENIEKNKSVGVSGFLKENVVTERLTGGHGFEVGEVMDYGPAVEFGTAPHFPPWKTGTPLWRWTMLKLHIDRENAENVSFLIARKISQVGTAARPFLGPAFDDVIKGFDQRFLQYMNRRIAQ